MIVDDKENGRKALKDIVNLIYLMWDQRLHTLRLFIVFQTSLVIRITKEVCLNTQLFQFFCWKFWFSVSGIGTRNLYLTNNSFQQCLANTASKSDSPKGLRRSLINMPDSLCKWLKASLTILLKYLFLTTMQYLKG